MNRAAVREIVLGVLRANPGLELGQAEIERLQGVALEHAERCLERALRG